MTIETPVFRQTKAGLGVTAAAVALMLAVGAQDSLAQGGVESAEEIIAAQIRSQGFECANPTGAERDPEQSRPDEPVWLLHCENQSYRVRLIPDQAAKVEPLGQG